MFQMIQNSLVAKLCAVGLLAASWFAPSARLTSCPGGNCPRQQCSHPATVVFAAPRVYAAPQLYSDELGDPLVLVEEPVHTGEPEDIVSPIATTTDQEDVKAEVDNDAEATTQESPKTEGTETQDRSAKTATTRDRATAKTQAAARTREVWMRASDARAAGLAPVSATSSGDGFGSLGSAGYAARVPPAATYRVTQSYGSVGSGYSAFYGDPVQPACVGCSAASYYPASAPVYRTRRVWFPNLFPRLRGLR